MLLSSSLIIPSPKQHKTLESVSTGEEPVENFLYVPCDLTHFSDVLLIPQVHNPYRWDIVGKGIEQAFQSMLKIRWLQRYDQPNKVPNFFHGLINWCDLDFMFQLMIRFALYEMHYSRMWLSGFSRFNFLWCIFMKPPGAVFVKKISHPHLGKWLLRLECWWMWYLIESGATPQLTQLTSAFSH